MRSEIVEGKKKESKFPKLMVNREANLVILVTEQNKSSFSGKTVYTGMAVHVNEESCYRIGEFNSDWTDFEDFHGTIKLSNY